MADEPFKTGKVLWLDLTVPDAIEVRNFYQNVIGWDSVSLPMQGYDDYCMNAPENGETLAGVCHQRGANEHLPPVWMVYFAVKDLDQSLKECTERGGEIVGAVRNAGGGSRYCVIRDPAGAYSALFQGAATA